MSFFGDLFKLVAIGAFFVATGPFGLHVLPGLATALRIGGFIANYIGQMIDQPDRLAARQSFELDLQPGTSLPVVYGTAKIGGIVADWTVDTEYNKNILYMPIAVCHGSRDGSGIKSVDEIWIDGLRGVVISGDVRSNYFTTDAFDYTICLGTDSQNVGTTDLTGLSSLFTDKSMSDLTWSATTDTGKGVATVLCRMLNLIVSDQHGPTYRGPPNVAFIVQGNSIEDTRTSTWVDGGTNPAMCVRDYLLSPIYGCGFDASLLNTDSFEDAADYCDAALTYDLIWTAANVSSSSVANPSVITTSSAHGFSDGDEVKIAGHSGSTPAINGQHFITYINATSFSIPVNVTVGGTGGTVVKVQSLAHRFTCNGVLDTSRPVGQNLQELLSSCRGQLVWEQGQFKLTIRNGSPPAATVALSPDNIIGEWSFRNAGLEDKWNIVRATYVDPLNGEYKLQDIQWPPVTETNNYLSADNDFVNELKVTLPFTNNQLMAQDICQVILNERRLGITAQMRCSEEVLAASVGDKVTVTHPTPAWTDKPFWVTAMELMPDTTVVVTLQEFDTTAYDPDTLEDLRTFPATGLTTSVEPERDLVFNGDFENGLDGWTVSAGTAVIDTTNQYAGANCLHLTGAPLASVTIYQSESGTSTRRYVAVVPGQSIQLSGMAGYVTGTTGTGPTASLAVTIYDSTPTLIGTLSSFSYATETSYTLKTIDFIVPNGAAYVSFDITLQVTVAGPSEFYIDQITSVPKKR